MKTKWPNLFLIGAPRCGTTSLFTYLAAHPGVFGPAEKEPHFYDRDILGPGGMTEEEYQAMYEEAVGQRLLIDASTLYLYSADAPAAIERDSPDAHIIVALRDPVELVASWHRLLVASGAEANVDLRAAVAAGGSPLPYVEIGGFAKHVVRWRAVFGDRVHVVLLEDIESMPDAASARLLQSLGLELVSGLALPHLNPARRAAGVAVWMNSAQGLRGAARRLLPQRIRRAVWHRVNRTLTPEHRREPVDPDVRRDLELNFTAELEFLAQEGR